MKKICIFLLVLLMSALAATVTLYVLWEDEIKTLISIAELAPANDDSSAGAVFYIDVTGGYNFDSFLAAEGCESEKALSEFIDANIPNGLKKISMLPVKAACSAFTCSTADFDRLLARNYDMGCTSTAIVHTMPADGRHESFSTVDLSVLGIDKNGPTNAYEKLLCLASPYMPLDGINSAGVGVAMLSSNQGTQNLPTDQKTAMPDITATTLVRLILDYADNVDEAAELAKKYDMHDCGEGSFHFIVADGSGKSAVLEWINPSYEEDDDPRSRKLVITYNYTAYQSLTNHVIADGYFYAVPEMIDADDSEMGFDRQRFIQDTLDQSRGKVTGENAAMGILAAVSGRNWDMQTGLTTHSVIYNMTDKMLYWVGSEHYGDSSYIFRYKLGQYIK